ncbi:MAG TPA: helix-turn-helix domain-containing protein [Vicinamibacterales bacterium]|nr:helix-turn-helix domain-containing protein [Vicinamibacterales bacterium]
MTSPRRPRSRREVLSEFRTAEILAAARSVFAARGFADATVDEVAQAAGVAKGTLYLYYRSKREIYLAALRSGVEELVLRLRQRLEAETTVEGAIRAFVQTRLAYFEAHLDFFRIYYSEFATMLTPVPASQRFVREIYLDQIRLLASALRAAADRTRVRPLDPDRLAFAIGELTRGLISDRALRGSQASVDEDVAFVLDLVWNGLAP